MAALVNAQALEGPQIPSDQVRRFRKVIDRVVYDDGERFPWRRTRSPFQLLLAEVLLQRTTGSHVLAAYEELVRQAPTASSLAAIPETKLASSVRRLGLNKRVPVLARLGQELVRRHRGRVPRPLEELMALPGVGRYTASAVRCFAFGQHEPIVDSGIARVLRRTFDLPLGRRVTADRELWEFADRLLGKRNARRHNLALLTIAQTYCRARPKCPPCPLVRVCAFGTRQLQTVDRTGTTAKATA
jgi:A/G-specific adenine glycosylase